MSEHDDTRVRFLEKLSPDRMDDLKDFRMFRS